MTLRPDEIPESVFDAMLALEQSDAEEWRGDAARLLSRPDVQRTVLAGMTQVRRDAIVETLSRANGCNEPPVSQPCELCGITADVLLAAYRVYAAPPAADEGRANG